MGTLVKEHMDEIRECSNASGRLNLMSAVLYKILEKNKIDYAENEYNTARLRDFISIFMEAVSKKSPVPLPELVVNLSVKYGKKLPQAKEKTQLDVTKEYLAIVAKKNGYTNKIELWMPLLGKQVYLDEFKEFTTNSFMEDGSWKEIAGDWSLSIVTGRMDDPATQSKLT